ncbi:MAG: hypothetical protein RDU89_07070 [bacterium]|nr:hypothetical protein [bacterium]
MQEVTIRSDPSEDSPRPWFEFEFNEKSLAVTVSRIRGLSRALGRSDRALEDSLEGKTVALQLNPDRATEIHVLAVTLDGELEFVAESQQRPIYYAHLAWYDPVKREAKVLKFVEESQR